MKRFYAAVLLIGFVAFSLGCALSDQEFTIRVTGKSGITFSGPVLTTKANGTSESREFVGTIPRDMTVKGTLVSVVLQKQDGSVGEMVVEIVKGGKVIAQGRTISGYGVVTVVGQ